MPHTPATAKGHMHQIRQGIKSTKAPAAPLPLIPEATVQEDFHPTDNPTERTHACYASTIPIVTGKTYSDQTGRFLIPSSRGNNYLFILYDYDSNIILAEPIPDRKGPTIKAAFIKIHNLLVH